jgi:hypothetical protein
MPGNGGGEAVGSRVRDVELRPVLPAFVQGRAVLTQQHLRRVDRLHILEVTRDGRDLIGPRRFQPFGDDTESLFPRRGLQLAVATHPGPIQPTPQQPVTGVPRLVVDPLLVDLVVDARQHAHHLTQSRVDADVAADRVHHVDAGYLAQLPRPCLETVGLGDERADRAQIDDIAAQFRRDRALEVGRDLRILAATKQPDLFDAGDLLDEADAARAVDAAGHDRLDDRTHIFLGHRALVLCEAVVAAAIGHGLVLQIAFAALVADRAIERMIDEQELHHALARLLDEFGGRDDFLIVRRRQCAGSLGLGRPRLHLDQAHPAIAGDGQPLMVAEARNLLARKLARLQHGRALRNLDLDAVDFDLGHASAHRAGCGPAV